MIIVVRGREIQIHAVSGTQAAFIKAQFEKLSDERLDELEKESREWTSSTDSYTLSA